MILREIKIPEPKTTPEKKIGTEKVQSIYEIYNRMTTLIKLILKDESFADVWKNGSRTNESFFRNLWNLPLKNIESIHNFFQNPNNQGEPQTVEKYKKIRDKFGAIFFKAVEQINLILDGRSKVGSSFSDVWKIIQNEKKPEIKRRASKKILCENVPQIKKCKKNEDSDFSMDNCFSPNKTSNVFEEKNAVRSPFSGYRIFFPVKVNSFIELSEILMI